MDYFVWYDENAQKTAAQKIQEAIAAFTVRFSFGPELVLVHSTDLAVVGGVLIRTEPMIQRNNFWLGIPEQTHVR